MRSSLILLALLVPLLPSAAADGPLPDAEVSHVDIFLPQLTGCTWSGSYKPYLSTEYVTVWHYTCDPET